MVPTTSIPTAYRVPRVLVQLAENAFVALPVALNSVVSLAVEATNVRLPLLNTLKSRP